MFSAWRREILEWLAIGLMTVMVVSLAQWFAGEHRLALVTLVVICCAVKTGYYVLETLWHLRRATRMDLPYHEFVVLIAYNMLEVSFSFGMDYFCLLAVDRSSLSGVEANLTGWPLVFECFYFSVLNFSYFGYGDLTPATVPAKMIVLIEIMTAFSTVIFLLSDFISMKESIRKIDQG